MTCLPTRSFKFSFAEIRTGFHETTAVKSHATSIEPAGIGCSTNKEKHVPECFFFFDTSASVDPGHALKSFVIAA